MCPPFAFTTALTLSGMLFTYLSISSIFRLSHGLWIAALSSWQCWEGGEEHILAVWACAKQVRWGWDRANLGDGIKVVCSHGKTKPLSICWCGLQHHPVGIQPNHVQPSSHHRSPLKLPPRLVLGTFLSSSLHLSLLDILTQLMAPSILSWYTPRP